MHELLFKRYEPEAPQVFYELTVEHSSDSSRPYCVRQIHHEFDGIEILPTDHIIDRFKTPEEANDFFARRKRALMAIGFLGH